MALKSVLLALGVLLLGGCVDVDTLIQVRTDGSGTVTQKVMVSERLVAPLRALTEGLGGDGKRRSLVMPDEEDMAARAEAMGPGVRLVDMQERRRDDAEGYVARYAFDDVRALRINQNPGNLAPGAGAGTRRLSGAEHITFDFSPGPPAELTVMFPDRGGREVEPRPPEDRPGGPGPEALRAELGELFKGLRVAMAVQVEGTVLETDATHRDGPRITLMAIDFEELLAAPEYLDELAERRPRSLEEAKELLRDFPGIKLELAPAIHIRFVDYGLRAI
ncbi:MAG: hypothetical protein U5S82_22090 [Gammaproteobacteria bacterium]|nr:hypothetical protein [Gammaproteobacteria bacterium]